MGNKQLAVYISIKFHFKILPVRELLVSFIIITNLRVLLFPSVAFPLTCNWTKYSPLIYIICSQGYIRYLATYYNNYLY